MANGQPPTFEQFSDVRVLKTQRVSVDLTSHPNARMYRTKLREGTATGPNFAGQYSVVSWGCGNECQMIGVVDLLTGEVLGIDGEREFPTTSRGVEFRLSSKLLIMDPPCSALNVSCESAATAGLPVRYYRLSETGLRLIYELPNVAKGDENPCGNQ